MRCVEYLTKAGADVNNALTDAVLEGNVSGLTILLKAGVPVNYGHINRECHTFLRYATHPQRWVIDWNAAKTIRLLFIAGQLFSRLGQNVCNLLNDVLGDRYEDDLHKDLIQEPFGGGDQISPERFSNVCFTSQCRRAIRRCLIDTDPEVNLFVKVPKLYLPSALNSYLFYDVALEELDIRDDNNDDADKKQLQELGATFTKKNFEKTKAKSGKLQ